MWAHVKSGQDGDVGMERFLLAALQMVGGLGSVQLEKLLQSFTSSSAIWQADEAALRVQGGLSGEMASRVVRFREKYPLKAEEIAEICAQRGISVCTRKDPMYPILLKETFHAPQVLYYRGTIPAGDANLAMVGARSASLYGKAVAEELAAGLAAQKITIVSGAAKGIDTAAHRGALRTGQTVAVLGCGVDVAYPAANRHLLDEIAERGAVLSEYAPGTPPLPAFFPARNRIISGMARGTIVVEAAEKSGSLITAELALSEGRDVFAVPGSIYSDTSRGCHKLIQQGAKLVMGLTDILEEYGVRNCSHSETPGEPTGMTEGETAIYAVLSWDKPQSIDEIIYKLHGNTANVAFLLLQMEIKGIVREDSAHAYVRAVKEGVL